MHDLQKNKKSAFQRPVAALFGPILLLACPVLIAAADFMTPYSVNDVLECVELNTPLQTFSQVVDIEVRDTTGKRRRMQARFLGRRDPAGLFLNIRLISPGNMAGTAVLVRERNKQPDDIRLYLPALERTRYISDAMSETKLFDTDFSYADIKQIYGAFIDSQTEYEGIETWEGRKVHKLRMLPEEAGTQPYDALITRVDTDTCVILGMDFLDVEQETQRQLKADTRSLTEIDSIHLAQRYTMSDLLRGSSTTLSLKNIRLDEKIPANVFEPDRFYEAP